MIFHLGRQPNTVAVRVEAVRSRRQSSNSVRRKGDTRRSNEATGRRKGPESSVAFASPLQVQNGGKQVLGEMRS
ncbi:hypothetical protein TGRH88_021990 [Toxoplasma gondii]|uniref:Uncharacterized protein n=1 Tax=Toxoplasma gondii TaxID=5811 RepID=A0A7J6KEQ8_TOXGO|nr:hypothetical protein TGRH88_021990 [Toxoplasma gondii]